MIHGCGAAVPGVVCAELDESHYMCKCPGEQNYHTVAAGEAFQGCPGGGTPPTPEEILASVNVTNLEANLINGVLEVLGVVVVSIDGDTFTLNITATVPIDTLLKLLAQQIADYLGGDYTADDIIVTTTTKRAESGTVVVQVTDNNRFTTSPATHLVYSWYGALILLLVLLF